MGMSAFYGSADEDEAVATIRRAIDLGCTFLDTAESYGPFTNEELIGRAIGGRRDEVQIATKFGVRSAPTPGKPTNRELDGSLANVWRSIEGSLRRLGTDHVDLFYLHRVDPKVPIEETVGAMAEVVAAGKARHIGLSEASATMVRRACAVYPVTALQSEFSFWTREVEAEILPVCRELGVGFVAYAPLGRGLLSQRFESLGDLDADDLRRRYPRFHGKAIDHNLQSAAKFAGLAHEKGCTPAQLALAWVLAQGDDIVTIPGTKRRTYLEENSRAGDVVLTPEDLAHIDAEVPPALGDRNDSVGVTIADR